MCGRFVITSSLSEIMREFSVKHPDFDPRVNYNISPGQDIPMIINEGGNRLVGCKWGFVPHWASDRRPSDSIINARAETVFERAVFRDAALRRRCLLVADGFYEWRKDGKVKTPFYVRLRSGRPMGFAGIYSTMKAGGGQTSCSCAIITTAANEVLGAIHERMPVILPGQARGDWLDPGQGDRDALNAILENTVPPAQMEAYEVARAVNSTAVDSPDNIRPV